MKKTLILISIAIFTACSSTQKITAVKDNQGSLVGVADKKSFQQEPFGSSWFNGNYKRYKTNKTTIEQLKPLLKNVTVKAFIGTWCGDSKRETPKFYKIMDEAKFNYKKLTMITVNRSKKANGLEQGYNVLRVPTFIFYKKEKEIGRFVEHTVNGGTIEGDFLKILSGKTYKHPYQK